jgi:hypothetical protein
VSSLAQRERGRRLPGTRLGHHENGPAPEFERGDVYVAVHQCEIEFDSGRAFLEDPVSRLMILPEVRSWFSASDLSEPLSYVADAIDRYWSEDKMALTMQVGCASARKP